MRLDVNVTKQQGSFLLDASFSLEGERCGLFGPSGSGKSTLIGIVAGMTSPDQGEVTLDGEILFSSEKRIALPPERRRIAVVFQHAHLFPHLSVRSNLLYGFKRCPAGERRIDLDAVVSALSLSGIIDRGVNNLSGGEKQRVGLGRALLSNPRLLLLDEPLSALDEDLKYRIIPYLRSVKEEFGVPFLFISHSLVEMRLMTERVLMMEKGRTVKSGTPEDLALSRMEKDRTGFINFLRLSSPRERNGLFVYRWGTGDLVLSVQTGEEERIFQLSSRDIILFRRNPEAISARNLILCRVTRLVPMGNKCGVELSCCGETLIAEVMAETAVELSLEPGIELFAAVKASAFRLLY